MSIQSVTLCVSRLLYAVLMCMCNTAYGQLVPDGSLCKAGEARLVDSSSASAGTLEVCYDGSWRTVCTDSLDTREAAMICRQLRFLPIGAEIENSAQYDSPTPGSMSLNLECSKDDNQFSDCEFSTLGEQECTSTAALRCLSCPPYRPSPKLFYCPDGTVKESGVVCIHDERRCDNVNDCIGGEDEYHCGSCSSPKDNGNIRLVDGHSIREGRLEICMNRRWGTVCDNQFDTPDAIVVCRQLGFSTPRAKFRRFGFGQSSVPIWLNELQCNGFEENLSNCTSRGRRNCGHFQDVGVMCLPAFADSRCENGDLRLDTSDAAVGGRLEVCYDGVWGSVCNEQWTVTDARVACNQLELPVEGATTVTDISTAGALIALSGLNCTGDEEKLINCPNLGFGNHDCTPEQAAGLYCGSCPPGDILCAGTEKEPQCISDLNICDGVMQCPAGDDELNGLCACTTPGELRLVGGTGPREGRVEMCYRGQWGTICDDGWDDKDAEVVCSQMGFGANDVVAYQGAFFGPGIGPIVLKGVDCTGDEERLLNCTISNMQDLNCTHSRDAGVACSPCDTGQFQCSSGTVSGNGTCINASQICDGVNDCVGGEDEQNIRLVGGTLPIEGRVEYCMGGEWGTICHNGWNNNDATVVCRQLGYDVEDAEAVCCASFGQGTGEQTILPHNFHCTGGERNLSQCRTSGSSRCNHRQDAGVICKCDDNTFPCRETTLDNPTCITEIQFCDGILDCPEGSDEPENCPKECSGAGELRLVDSDNQNEGRVEICFGGQWGTVCDDSWDYRDAAVVCKQLGYGTLGAVARPRSFYGQGTGLVHLDDINCEGDEDTLINCNRRRFGSVGPNCKTHAEDASVICPTLCPDHQYQCECGRIDGQQSPCISTEQRCDGVTDCLGGDDELEYNCPCRPEGAVRLVDGIVPYRGRLEFCMNGKWSGICSNRWDNRDASVVCRQLGYPSEGAKTSCCGLFGTGPDKQPLFRDFFNCRGNERNLSVCPRSVGADCSANQQDVVVECIIPEEQFPCLNSTPDFLSNVTELQFCDGNADCADSSDEPSYCPGECLEPGKLRLVNNERISENEGRIEICFGGRWGTICDDSWDYFDAQVACRQLGFGTAGALAYVGSRYNPGSGPIHLDGVGCSGSANNVDDCRRSNYGYVSPNCRSHFEDASVLCPTLCPDAKFQCSHGRVDGQQSPCISTEQRCDGATDCIGGEDELDYNCPCGPEEAVRLVGGSVPYRGRVETCRNRRWRSICSGRWDNRDAAVVCRQLGYPTEGASAYCCARYGRGPDGQLVLRDNYNCRGNEKNLSECSKSAGTECGHGGDVSVICSSPFDDFQCTSAPPDTPSNVTELQFCDGVSDCVDDSDEPQYCPAECLIPGEIRLVNGGITSGSEGRVEICFGGQWGTVCDDSWDYHDAAVVCRQLGLQTRGATGYGGSRYGPGTGSVHLDDIGCTGSENALTNCPSRDFGEISSNCRSHLEDASVVCSSVCTDSMLMCHDGRVDGKQPACVSTEQRCDNVTDCIGGEDELEYNCPCGPEGAVRLVDGIVPYRGRVEFCINSRWSTVCNRWDIREAAVVCRQLGYPSEDAAAVCCGRYRNTHNQQPVVRDNFNCRGNEKNLSECPKTRGAQCDHRTDGSVICSTSQNEFLCPNAPPNTRSNVTELQFCDGVVDCADGSDEPNRCSTPECPQPGALRLVHGQRTGGPEGRVEICIEGKWGTVCDDSWDYRDAEVVCRQLGFGVAGAVARIRSQYGPGMGSVYLDDVACTRSEKSLLNCSQRYVGDVSSNCRGHSEDAAVICPFVCPEDTIECTDGRVDGQQPPCISSEQRCDSVTDCIGGEDELDHNCPCGPEGAVRLVDGTVPYRGRVEFCKSGRWSTICNSRFYQWHNSDASVVCHQLGYPRTGATAHSRKFIAAHNSQPLEFDNFNCRGTEINLLKCSRGIGGTCQHTQDASVICKCSEANTFQCTETLFNEPICVSELKLCDGVADCPDGSDELVNCGPECSTPGEVRLVNNNSTNGHQGRVEICYKGRWGTVCHDSWDYRDAEVVCRQLGFTASGAIPHSGSQYGPGKGPVYLNSVGCIGSESNITECTHSYFGDVSSSCKAHFSDASVSCATECQFDEQECTEGRVDGQQSPCISAEQRCNGITDCIGGEDELNHNCFCEPEGAVRLVDGTVPYRGRVEFCKSGRWSTICNSQTFRWQNSDAAVVCHQLGYPRAGAEAHRRKYLSTHSSQPLEFDYFNCRGTESNLLECSRSVGRVCQHNLDASVICKCSEDNMFLCSNNSQVERVCVSELQVCDGIEHCPNGSDEPADCSTECTIPGQVRLVNGGKTDGYEGRVEICFKGRWGTVCHDSWDYQDAEVVCRQLGFGSIGAAALTGSHYGPGKGPVYLNSVRCTGSESNITECSHSLFGDVSSTCAAHFSDASVLCPTECSDDEVMCSDGRVDGHLSPCISTEKRCDGVIDCIGGEDELDHNCPCGPEGAVRLVDGIVPQQGRVEFCRSKRWVKVCFWTPNSAPVVCRQLGFPTADAEGVSSDIFGTGPTTQPIMRDFINCRGTESSLSECQRLSSGNGCPDRSTSRVICTSPVVRTFPCSETERVNELKFCDGKVDCSNSVDEPSGCPSECNDPGKIRLVYGNMTGGNQGRVELCFGGQWGTVCSTLWDNIDAAVVCRQLGFGTEGAVAFRGSRYGWGSGPVYINFVRCSGSEDSLLDCNPQGRPYFGEVNALCTTHVADASVYCPIECSSGEMQCRDGRIDSQQPACISMEQRCDGIIHCVGGEDEYCADTCSPEGAVRLVGGLGPHEGRVEFCKNGQWATLCGRRFWDRADAVVICRQLGYPTENAVSQCCSSSRFGPGYSSQPIIDIDFFLCNGNEANLSQCDRTTGSSCEHIDDASVICNCPENKAIPCSAQDEIEPTCVSELQFCDGNADCPDGSDEDINCANECSIPGQVRLVKSYGSNENEGRVEICFKGQWGTVCDDSWDYRDAEVVCRQLGYGTNGAVAYLGSRYGPGSGPLYLDDISCFGSEDALVNCSRRSFGDVSSNCKTHFEDASVLCKTVCPEGTFECTHGRVNGQQPSCISTDQRCDNVTDCIGGEDEVDYNCPCDPEGAVRLVDGIVPYRGRVEFCKKGRWLTLCNSFGRVVAAVICRQLGYSSEGVEQSLSDRFGKGPILQHVLQDIFRCTGSENSLSECQTSVGRVCGNRRDMTLICSTRDHEFPCVEDQHTGVTELQFCNGISDCVDNSDEPPLCGTECFVPGELRLVNGDMIRGNEGRVEVCFGGRWGTVCDDSWDYRDAEVVCRQLGFGTAGATSYTESRYGPGNGSVYLDNVACDGSENILVNCTSLHIGELSSNCRSHFKDASVFCPSLCPDAMFECHDGRINGQQSPCIASEQRCNGVTDCIGGEDELEYNCPCGPEGAVRLVDGIVPYRGRVEFCKNGRWSSICKTSFYTWDNSEAAVVCRQLGYQSEGAEGSCCGRYRAWPERQPVLRTVFLCNGLERSLSECRTVIGSECNSRREVSVLCSSDTKGFYCANSTLQYPSNVTELQFCDGATDCPNNESDEPTQCPEECLTPGELRLVNGNIIGGNEGRVEICFGGKWGTVCDDSWDYRDAKVVCRQLGFGTIGAVAHTGSRYGPSTGPLLLDEVACTGFEDSLDNCSRRSFGDVSSNCRSNNEDASVVCPTVCPDHKFDCPHGRVDGQQPPCIPSEQRCDGTTDCIGGEDELDHNCPCEPEGAVRLVDGIVAYRGRVEFCKSGRWFSICNSQTFRWRNTNYNAAVVCHQLGYPNGAEEAPCCGRYFPGAPNQQPVFQDLFHCTGSESSLSECSRTVGSQCGHRQDISVICSTTDHEFPCQFSDFTNETKTELQFCDGTIDCNDGPDEPNDCPLECLVPGEVRLVNGNKTGGLEGRVEICFGGRWGTVCDDSWDHRDAEVVCRQLGFGTRGAMSYSSSHFGPGTGPVHLDDVSCMRSEKLLTDCSYRHFGVVSSNCRSHLEDAGIGCRTICPENTIECQNGRVDGQGPPCISTEQRCNNVTDCIGGEDELDYNCPCGPEGTVRLVGGILPHRGRVELCTNGGWSTLCNNQWDRNDAAVVCRQLGYRSAGAQGSRGRFGGRPSGQQQEFDYFNCRGSEESLLECRRNVGGACSSNADADVICKCPNEHMFPCVVMPPDEPYCISELKFCDGIVDCPGGSDEPLECEAECSTPGEIRLVNGNDTHGNEGRVEICFNGQWGTICHNSWDYLDAEVVCRQLGFGATRAVSYPGSHYGPGKGPVHLSSIGCTGAESNLTDCSHSIIGDLSSSCTAHLSDASVFCPTECSDDKFMCSDGRVDGQQPPCISTNQRCDNVTDCIGGEDELEYNCPCGPDGVVRLVDGVVPNRGRVEFCRNGRWSTVCSINNNFAAVLCRQLGYPSAGAVRVSCCQSYNAGPTRQPIHKDGYSCRGNENDLSQCRVNVGRVCSHNRDASVICRCPMENQFPCQDTEGNPLCISELQFCDGVSDCGDGSDEPSYCSDECSTPGELQLVNGNETDGNEGRVEICYRGQWGTICQDSWNYYDTEVACRQLGLGTIEAESYNGARYGRGKGPVYLNTLQCSGSEDTLVECRRRSYFGQVTPSCRGHSRDVSILCGKCPDNMFECKTGRVDGQTPPCISTEQRCDNKKDCLGGEDELGYSCPCSPEGAVRLVGGSGLHEGRVEFCRKSVWATICNRFNQWGTTAPAVVCRQLGYSTQGVQSPRCCADFGSGPNTQPVDRAIFYCSGRENSLSDCRQRPDYTCSHIYDASVICEV